MASDVVSAFNRLLVEARILVVPPSPSPTVPMPSTWKPSVAAGRSALPSIAQTRVAFNTTIATSRFVNPAKISKNAHRVADRLETECDINIVQDIASLPDDGDSDMDKSSWSPELASLKMLSVTRPADITAALVRAHFRTLLLRDCRCTELGSLLDFRNLTTLSLTANYLRTVVGDDLPRSLTILHLNANCLESLESLAQGPPPKLAHLGLSANNISHCSSSCFSPAVWSHLLSLDLSDNALVDLPETLAALASLPRLLTLSLQGNPIYLLQCYRSLVQQRLPNLTLLDNQPILPSLYRKPQVIAEQSATLTACLSISLKLLKYAPEYKAPEAQDDPKYVPTMGYSYEFRLLPPPPTALSPAAAAKAAVVAAHGAAAAAAEAIGKAKENGSSTTVTGGNASSSTPAAQIPRGAQLLLPLTSGTQPWSDAIHWAAPINIETALTTDLKFMLESGFTMDIVQTLVTLPSAKTKKSKSNEILAPPAPPLPIVIATLQISQTAELLSGNADSITVTTTVENLTPPSEPNLAETPAPDKKGKKVRGIETPMIMMAPAPVVLSPLLLSVSIGLVRKT